MDRGFCDRAGASKFGDVFFLLVRAWFVDDSSVVFTSLFAAKIK